MTKIIVVINQKGGVGKSTLAFHLAHAAAEEFVVNGKAKKNNRVLCIDLDSQANFSQYLTGDLDICNVTTGGVGDLLEGLALNPLVTSHEGIDLLHGHANLDQFDGNVEIEDRGYSPTMREYLRSLDYDVIIIDTPPAVGFRHMAPLCWADLALIPMEPVMSSIVGFQNVLSAIADVISPINPGLKWVGVINRANMRVKSHRVKDEFVRSEYGDPILETLSTRTSVSDAMEEEPAQPVWLRKSAPKALREQWHRFCKKVISN